MLFVICYRIQQITAELFRNNNFAKQKKRKEIDNKRPNLLCSNGGGE